MITELYVIQWAAWCRVDRGWPAVLTCSACHTQHACSVAMPCSGQWPVASAWAHHASARRGPDRVCQASGRSACLCKLQNVRFDAQKAAHAK